MPVGTVHPEVFVHLYQAAIEEVGEKAHEIFAPARFDTRFPIDDAMAIWAGLVAVDVDGTLGARLGRRQTTAFGDLSLVRFASGSQATLFRGLRVLARFFPLISSNAELSVEIRPIDGGSELWIRPLYGPGPRSALVAQNTLMNLLLGLREVVVDIKPRFVLFAAPVAAGVEARLATLFGAPVSCSQGVDALVFDGEIATFPLPPAPPFVRLGYETRAEAIFSTLDTSSPFVEDIIKEIQAILPEVPSIDRVAESLGTSSRGLQRALKMEGLSFREVCSRTRAEIAKGYLAGDASVTEAAFLVAYSDATAFSRAYRAVFGHAPNRDQKRP